MVICDCCVVAQSASERNQHHLISPQNRAVAELLHTPFSLSYPYTLL